MNENDLEIKKTTIKQRLLSSGFVKNYKRLLGEKPTTTREAVKFTTVRLAYTGVLIAICLLFNVITFYPVKYLAFSFTCIPTFIAGILLGPLSGFAVGFLGDLLGWVILPQGAYMPLVGVASGLFGFIPGILFLISGFSDLKYYVKIIIGYAACVLFCTCFLNTFNIWLVYASAKTSFWSYLWLRLPFQFAMAAVNCFLTILIYRELKKVQRIKIRKK